jgi:hypothetical protein
MALQALLGQQWADSQQLWAELDARRARLNQDIPSRVLGGLAALQAYPNAAHSGRHYRPEWEGVLAGEAPVRCDLANTVLSTDRSPLH